MGVFIFGGPEKRVRFLWNLFERAKEQTQNRTQRNDGQGFFSLSGFSGLPCKDFVPFDQLGYTPFLEATNSMLLTRPGRISRNRWGTLNRIFPLLHSCKAIKGILTRGPFPQTKSGTLLGVHVNLGVLGRGFACGFPATFFILANAPKQNPARGCF